MLHTELLNTGHRFKLFDKKDSLTYSKSPSQTYLEPERDRNWGEGEELAGLMKSSPSRSHSTEAVWIPPGMLPPPPSASPSLARRSPWPRPAHPSMSRYFSHMPIHTLGILLKTLYKGHSTHVTEKTGDTEGSWKEIPPSLFLSPCCRLWSLWAASSKHLDKHKRMLTHYSSFCNTVHTGRRADTTTNRSYGHNTLHIGTHSLASWQILELTLTL